MTPRVDKALVVGGGISGMCAAIQLSKFGMEVDLVEIDPDWRTSGTGITLQGPTLRAFTEIGVIDEILAEGWCADGVDICNASGDRIAELPTPRIGRTDVPGGGGILRPILAEILRKATRAARVRIRCGQTVKTIDNLPDGVRVLTTDGREETYDLVVCADGLRSAMRGLLFPDAPAPMYTGQGAWRAVVPRPSDIQRAVMFMGAHLKAGMNPVSRSEMYLFLTEPHATPEHIDQSALAGMLRGLLSEFGGLVADVREQISSQSRITYRPFWALLLPPPWSRGRVVLVGDAVHSTTPHLASGAGIGVEDAIVLAEEITKSAGIPKALASFTERRFDRCRIVVENSLRLGEIECKGGSNEEHAQLMRNSMQLLRAAY
jgi:naringenin degradation protein FdeE